jgi:WD40 repeat protein
MSAVPEEPENADDDQLTAAIEEYYRWVERHPGVDRRVFLVAHPDLAEELNDFFATLDEMDRLAKTAPHSAAGRFAVPRAAVEEPLQTVRYFGDYELLAEVARGGMGVIYRARQVSLNRTVAVKMILAGRLASSTDVARFRHEAEGAAKLQHPNIVTIFEVGEHQGQHFFSMEFVEGGTLAQLVRDNPLSAVVAAEHARTIAKTMVVIHAAGLLHRDLKPSNVLIDARSGMLRITDFGLVKSTDMETLFTSTGQVLGTPSYMAPEQAGGRNDDVGPASDIYSIGAILYELMTGRPPFLAETPWETAWRVQHAEVVAPSSLNHKVPRDLETICLKCLHKTIGRRYATAQELADELGRFLRGEPIHARPVSRAERAWRWCRRNPALASAVGAAATGLAALCIVLAVFALVQRESAKTLASAVDISEGRRRDATLRLAESYRDKAIRLCQQGDIDQGCLWHVRSLEIAPADADELRWSIRISLAAWQRELCTLLPKAEEQAIQAPSSGDRRGSVRYIFSPDGKLAVTAPDGKSAELTLANRKTGEVIGHPLAHPAKVEAVVFSSDGRRLATAYGHGEKNARVAHVQYWDASTGSKIGEPLTHAGAADFDHSFKHFRILFAADGERLFTISANSWSAWDRDGKQLAGPLPREFGDNLFEVSRDGRLVAYRIKSRGSVRVNKSTWRDAEPESHLYDVDARRAISQRLGKFEIAAFSTDGRRLATGYQETLVRNKSLAHIQVWDATTGEKIGNPLVHAADRRGGHLYGIYFRANDQRLFTVSSDSLYVWDQQGNVLAGPVSCSGANGPVSVSADGRLVAFRSSAGELRLWDVDAQQTVGQPLGRGNGELSPDGRIVVAGDRRWSVPERGLLAGPLVHDSKYSGFVLLDFSQDSRFVISAGFYNATARLWDARTGDSIGQPLEQRLGFDSHAVAPDGQWMVVGSQDNPSAPNRPAIVFWEPRAGRTQARQLPRPRHGVRWLALSNDGKWLAVTGDAKGEAQIFIYDVEKDKIQAGPWLHPKVIDPYIVTVYFAPDARVLLSLEDQQDAALLWNRETGERIGKPLKHEAAIRDIAFSPDSRTLVTVGKHARFWNTATGEAIPISLASDAEVIASAFSPDGKWLATLHNDRTARIWDAATGKWLGTSMKHVDQPRQVAFALAGRLLATSTQEGVFIWEPLTGIPVGPPLRPATNMAVSPDGRTIAAATDQDFRLWDVPRPAIDDAGRLKKELESSTGTTLPAEGARESFAMPEFVERK